MITTGSRDYSNKKLNSYQCECMKARPKRKLSYYGISDNNKIRYLTMLRLKMSPLTLTNMKMIFLTLQMDSAGSVDLSRTTGTI